MSIQPPGPYVARVVTKNCEDLFGPNGGPYPDNKPKPPEDCRALADDLRQYDADVLLLQEVGDEETLRNFMKHYMGQDGYQYLYFSGTNAVASRTPILETRVNKDEPLTLPDGTATKFARDVTEALVNVKGIPMRLYSIHFKANPFYQEQHTPEEWQAAKDRRLAEGQGLAHIVLRDMAAYPHQFFLAGGDANAPAGTPEIDAIEAAGLVDTLRGRNDEAVWSHPATHDRMDFAWVTQDEADSVVNSLISDTMGGSDHRANVTDIDVRKVPARIADQSTLLKQLQ